MLTRRLFAMITAACIIFASGAAFAAGPPVAGEVKPDAPPSVVYAVPPVLMHGMTVDEFLRNEAAQDPDAWVGSSAAPDEPVSGDELVCTGMRLHREGIEGGDASAIVVRGDVLGQGRLTLSQLVCLAALTRCPDDADELAVLAGDLNQDGVISLSDLCAAALPFRELLPPDQGRVISDMLSLDVLGYIPAETYQTDGAQKWYRPVLGRRDTTLSLPGRYIEWLDAAAAGLSYDNVARVETDFEAPSWALLAATAANCKSDPDKMRSLLNRAVNISVSSRREGSDTVLEISARPADPTELFYSVQANGAANPFSLSTSYAYLSTLFDDSMNERYGIGYPELEPLLFPIARPSRYYVGDCWYDPRDQGARRHTGTDVNAPRGTDLLACVNGTIIGNGWDDVAGNYIVLRGEDGTQYHYYHMVRLSDVPVGTEVRRGEVIGHVGSTGNSRANHLHFTVITAGGQYVNPVTYLQRAQTATANGTIGPA